MKETRSASQILYGHLPQQTVDVRGGVWKVKSWKYKPVHEVDAEALSAELIRLAAPWEASGRDGRLVASLRAGANVQVRSLDRELGAWLEPFPKTWRCKNCSRLLDSPRARCKCGAIGPHGQLPFVLFHDACGDIREPSYPRCPAHDDVRMRLPGTTSLREIELSCPECNRTLRSNFLYTNCTCGQSGRNGERMEFTVHRSASVYVPRSVVIVNPPSRTQRRRLHAAGGGPAALAWIAEGMASPWVDGVAGAKSAALRRTLAEQGLTPEQIDAALAAAGVADDKPRELRISPEVNDAAEYDASAIALAMSETRKTIGDLKRTATGKRQALYDGQYDHALKRAGVQRIDLVERFPILNGQFGYTRGDHEPGASRLRAFTERDGTVVVYGDLATTEALITRLDPVRVSYWLRERGHGIEVKDNIRDAYEGILGAVGNDPENSAVLSDITTLVHSFSHRMVRQTSYYAGIDRESISELLFPLALAFVTYAVPRGDFVLGGLQAMFEHDLHTVLDRVVLDESRCALDPGCWESRHGAACAVCLHLGEPSCRLFNTRLDRKVLFDTDGYFRMRS